MLGLASLCLQELALWKSPESTQGPEVDVPRMTQEKRGGKPGHDAKMQRSYTRVARFLALEVSTGRRLDWELDCMDPEALAKDAELICELVRLVDWLQLPSIRKPVEQPLLGVQHQDPILQEVTEAHRGLLSCE